MIGSEFLIARLAPTMSIITILFCIVLMIAALSVAIYWGAVLYHIAKTMSTIPTCRDALLLPAAAELRKPTAPKVCIIVPAHNEQGVVGKLAASLVKQTYPNLSVVFALDRCTDGTASEIREATGGADHMELLEIRECPSDWAGKVNAIRVAVRTSKAAQAADLLLFTDADTEFDPDCVRAAVALLTTRSLGMLSIMSTLTTDRTFERIAQPAAGMELMRQYPLARAPRADAPALRMASSCCSPALLRHRRWPRSGQGCAAGGHRTGANKSSDKAFQPDSSSPTTCCAAACIRMRKSS